MRNSINCFSSALPHSSSENICSWLKDQRGPKAWFIDVFPSRHVLHVSHNGKKHCSLDINFLENEYFISSLIM